jgi:flagellar motor protein MotB
MEKAPMEQVVRADAAAVSDDAEEGEARNRRVESVKR